MTNTTAAQPLDLDSLMKALRFQGRYATETEDQARMRRYNERQEAANAIETLIAHARAAQPESAAPSHETIISEGDRLVCTACGTSATGTTGATEPSLLAIELQGVREEIAEGSGFWSSCSGCYDTEDGHPTGPYSYSHVLGCALGSGCSECGGIGAVWDNTDYEAMARDWDKDAAPASAQPDRGAALTKEQVEDIIQAIKTSMNFGAGIFFPRGWNVLLDKLHAMRDTASPASQPVAPSGWKPMPIQPTKEMMDAARLAWCITPGNAIEESYAAMWRAAPAAVAPSDAKGEAGAANAGVLERCPICDEGHLLRMHFCNHCGAEVGTDADATHNATAIPATSAADAKDAARWRLLPAIAEDHEINLLKLYRDIDAAMAAAPSSEKGDAK